MLDRNPALCISVYRGGMDGYDAVLAAGVEHRIYSLSLPVLWRRLCRRSLYRIPGKGVDCNVKADRSGSCGFFD